MLHRSQPLPSFDPSYTNMESIPNHGATASRIGSIDALRGLALFGILVVNICVFNAPYAHYGAFYGKFEGFQSMVIETVITLAGGKFMFIFAFLFGYGCWMQFSRAESYLSFRSFWWRRMSVLAVFGLLHLLLFWFGDILLPYALLGFTLPFFVKQGNKTLVISGVVLYFFPVIFSTAQRNLGWAPIGTASPIPLDEFIQVFGNGSFAEIFELRWHEYWSFRNEKLVFYIPKEWGLFLLGIWASRKQLFTAVPVRRLLPFLIVFISIALAWEIFKHDVFAWTKPAENPKIIPLLIGFNTMAEFMHGSSYILGFIALWRINIMQKLLSPLKWVGRMSLTQYFLQSLVCVFIFYSYGFGLYGQLKPSQLVGLATAIFSVQVAISYFWLQNRKQGPLEAIWRLLSYRKR